MNELRESFGDRGLQILAISNESSGTVGRFVEDKGVTYTVGLSTDALGLYGGGGIPHAYLVGPDGVVVWEGHPAGLEKEEIEKAVRLAFSLRPVVAQLKQAAAAFEKGKLAEAKTLALAAKAKGGREVEADADYMIGRADEIVAAWKQAAEQADANCVDALDALGRIQRHCPGTEEAAVAAAKEKELRADPAVQRQLDAWKKFEKLQAEAQKAQGDEKRRKAVAKKLEGFLEKFPAALAAKPAQRLLDALRKAK